MDQPLVSVIVPMYNSSKTIARCLDGLLAQSYTNFEVLVIDDGSVDDTATICRNYSKKDDRVRYFHQSNMGPSCARNEGIRLANGSSVAFVDADDCISELFIESLVFAAITSNADISCCGYSLTRNQRPYKVVNVSEDAVVIDAISALKSILLGAQGGYLCNKLF